MSTYARFHKRFAPLCVLFDGTNTADVDTFTRATGKPGGFRARETADGDLTHEVYDYMHRSWIGVKADQWVARGPVDEHYPIAAEVLGDTTNYIREDVSAAEAVTWPTRG